MPKVPDYGGFAACGSCDFSKHLKDDMFECRRHPPRVIDALFRVEGCEENVDFATRFPLVDREEWCGEWTAADWNPND